MPFILSVFCGGLDQACSFKIKGFDKIGKLILAIGHGCRGCKHLVFGELGHNLFVAWEFGCPVIHFEALAKG